MTATLGVSAAMRIKYIQAAKEGDLEAITKFTNDGISVDTRDSAGFTALHWASAHGQSEIINFLIFYGADVNVKSNDGTTSLHLAAKYKRLNAVHLLIEAGANTQEMNEKRETPLDLCGEDPPLKSLLSGTKERSVEAKNSVLYAAKELLNSTLIPISANEEAIILAADKAEDDAEKLTPANSSDYAAIQQSLHEHQRVLGQFKSSLELINAYRTQLEAYLKNVVDMGTTLDHNEVEVASKLQKSRLDNTQSQEKRASLEGRLKEATQERTEVQTEIQQLQEKLESLKSKKQNLDEEISSISTNLENVLSNQNVESVNETAFAEQQESLLTTKSLISNGIESFNGLSSSTSDRTLKLGLSYSNFLISYNNYVKKLVESFESNKQKMKDRIDNQADNLKEIDSLHLKMDQNKIKDMINEYQTNLDRFDRRSQKFSALFDEIRSEYENVRVLIGSFGRELQPLETK